MRARTHDELGRALGCLVYDMLILLVAVSLHRKRHQYQCYEGLTWGEPQICIDVINLKCRALMDFISPGRHTHDDIVIMDFGLHPVVLPNQMRIFRRSINQWTAHLSWQRALRSSKGAPQPAQTDMEECAVWLLSQVYASVSKCLAAGVKFVEERHDRFYNAFETEYSRFLVS